MATWCVYHLIHVRTPHQHLPKLIVTDVPEGETVDQAIAERAGYMFGEFGISFANHVVERIGPDSPSDLVGRIRAGEGERITWADLKAKAEAPL